MPAAPEAWLRGPIPGIDPLLMPAAHALVQASEDVARAASPTDQRSRPAVPPRRAHAATHRAGDHHREDRARRWGGARLRREERPGALDHTGGAAHDAGVERRPGTPRRGE